MGCAGEPSEPVGDRRAPIIVISVDTLRSDRLPMYGHEAIETPALDALRADSILYERAYATVPLTLPSHASILTGLDPDRHGVRSNVGYAIDSELESLPRLLASRGYRTGAAVSAWVLRRETGMGDHFSFYDDEVGAATGISFANVQRPGRETVARALDWIAEQQGEPLFFMLHLFEPHMPFSPPADLSGRYTDPYDGEIVETDRIVGDFLSRLEELGLYDDALIIFLSDHGEGLNDHGEPGHGIFLYREAIQVPLLIKLPRGQRAGETVTQPVSLIDVAPTVASFFGFPVPESMGGADLLGSLSSDRAIYSETLYPRLHLGWSELRSLIRGDEHLIEAPRPELYDVVADPGETQNLVGERRRTYASLREELADRPLGLQDPSSVDPEEAAKLAALGYLGSTVSEGDGELPDPKDRIGDLQALIRAMDLAATGDRAESIEVFRGLLRENPALVEGWLQLGRLLDEEGRWEESLEAYQAAIRAVPAGSGETALSIAEILLRLGRFDEASRHVELGRTVNPHRASLIEARIALARGDLDQAERMARAVPAGVHRNEAEVLLATVLAKIGRLDEAMRVAEATAARLIERGEAPPEGLFFVKGDILARMEQLDLAASAFEKEIELYPGHLQAYANLAVVELVRQQPERAGSILAEMERRNPSDRARRFAARTRDELGLR